MLSGTHRLIRVLLGFQTSHVQQLPHVSRPSIRLWWRLNSPFPARPPRFAFIAHIVPLIGA